MMKKRATKRKSGTSTGVKNIPAEQRDDDYAVGPGCPPKEHQFKPGESGNPDGPPKRRTNLWVWFTRYMGMTDARISRLNRDKLAQSQQVALNLVEKIKAGEKVGSTAFARYIVDREEGKAVEHIVIGEGTDLSGTECEELRTLIQGKHSGDARDTD